MTPSIAGNVTRDPAVSVCIPVYNGQRYIVSAIESVLAQTFQDFEIVVADDASKDDTFDLVRKIADPRIRLMRNPAKTGIGLNWNRAVKESRGKLIKILGHDDLLYPACLEAQVAILNDPAHRDVVIVCARHNIIDEEGQPLLLDRGPTWRGKLQGRKVLRWIVRSGTNPMGEPASVLFRKADFARTDGFDGARPSMIDIDLWFRLMQFGNLYFQPQTLSALRVSLKDMTATRLRSQAREARQFLSMVARGSPDTVGKLDLMRGYLNATILAETRRLKYAYLRKRKRSAPAGGAVHQ